MSRILVTTALLFLYTARAGAQTHDAGSPALANDRVIFHTTAGDLLFSLDESSAPQTVAQFLQLVRAGVYDTTGFSRIQPGFYIQVSSALNRTQPLTATQTALLHPIALEATKLKHERFVLSMTHKQGDPNSAESSFSILLGNAPQLDGKYTIFGKLESGEDVIAQLLTIPRSADGRPTMRLSIDRAEVITADALTHKSLVKAHAIPGAPPASAASALLAGATVARGAAATAETSARPTLDLAVACGIFVMVLLAIGSATLRGRIAPRHSSSMDLVIALIGAFLLLVILFPEGQHRGWLAAALFFGLIAILKLLGRSEVAEK